VVYDVTHSVQLPGGKGNSSEGNRNLLSHWRAQAWRRAWMGSFWRRMTTLQQLVRMDLMLYRSRIYCPAPEIEKTQHRRPPLECEMSLDTARRVLKSKRKRFKTSWRVSNTSLKKAVDLLFACQRPRRRHRHGKVRPHRPKIAAHFPAREPFLLLTRGRSSARGYGHVARGDALLAAPMAAKRKKLSAVGGAQRLEMPLVTLTGKLHSTLAEASDVALDVSVRKKRVP